MPESLKNKTVNGVGWSFVSSLSSYAITFIVGIVLARLLTPEEYGLIGIITIFVSVFNAIVDSGLSNALIRKQDVDNGDYNTVFIANIFFSIVLCAILVIIAPLIGILFKNVELVPLTRVMSFCLVINALALVQQAQLTKDLDFKTQTKCSVGSSLISGALGIAAAFKGYGVWALVIQQISRQLFNTLLLWFYRRWRPTLFFSLAKFSSLWSFGWKLLVSGILNSLWNQAYQIVIGMFYSPVTLGYYTKGSEYVNLVSQNLTTVAQRVSYPILSKIQDDKVRMKSAYKRIIKMTMFASFTLVLGLCACSKSFIIVLIGVKWLPCVPMIQLLCLTMVLYPLHAINLNMLQVQGRSDLFLKLEILKKCIAIIPIVLGIFFDIYWMLGGGVFINLYFFYLNARYSGPFLNYSIIEQVKDITPSFFVAGGMAIIVYIIGIIELPPILLLSLQILAGIVVLITLCKLFKLEEYVEIIEIIKTFKTNRRK